MKAVILAGGRGTRMGHTSRRPKPLMEIGGRPVVSHVMDLYRRIGIDEFVLCCGFKFTEFVEWLRARKHWEEATRDGDTRFGLRDELGKFAVTLVNTGESTASGGRLARVARLLDSTFFLTYADGLSDVNLSACFDQHVSSGALMTLTAFPLSLPFGVAEVPAGKIFAKRFVEKPTLNETWCNGGFYVVEPSVVTQLCRGDETVLEVDVLPQVADGGRLGVVRHHGFWSAMDFPHQHKMLEELYRENGPVWLR